MPQPTPRAHREGVRRGRDGRPRPTAARHDGCCVGGHPAWSVAASARFVASVDAGAHRTPGCRHRGGTHTRRQRRAQRRASQSQRRRVVRHRVGRRARDRRRRPPDLYRADLRPRPVCDLDDAERLAQRAGHRRARAAPGQRPRGARCRCRDLRCGVIAEPGSRRRLRGRDLVGAAPRDSSAPGGSPSTTRGMPVRRAARPRCAC